MISRARTALRRVGPCLFLHLEIEKSRHGLPYVLPIGRIVRLYKELSIRLQAAMCQRQESRGHQAPTGLPDVVKRLRMVTMQLMHAGGGKVSLHKRKAVTSGKTNVRQSPLVGAARRVT